MQFMDGMSQDILEGNHLFFLEKGIWEWRLRLNMGPSGIGVVGIYVLILAGEQ